MKAAVITIVGRPSVGKSTLLNRLCGRKVSIVSASPQTTRNTIRGVLTEPRGQLVFIDTPGFHLSNRKINLRMKSLVAESLREVDVTLYLIDSTRRPGEEERAIAEILASSPTQVVVVVTKVDLLGTPQGQEAGSSHENAERLPDGVAALLSELLPKAPVRSVSALSGLGVADLTTLLLELAPEGAQMYPEEFYTDQPPEFRVSEIIREKAIERVRQEVPHALYVEVADMELPQGAAREPLPGGPPAPRADEGPEGEQLLWIRAFLIVERESQKGILIGRGGSMIKEIRVSAQKEIEEIFPYRIHLDLRVKVNPKWRKNDPTLRRLIY